MRIELAQIRKYSPSDDIVNEIIYFVYDSYYPPGQSFDSFKVLIPGSGKPDKK